MSQERILVLEDDPVLRWLIAEIMTSAGYVVTQAADLREAVHTLNDHEVDLAVLDRNLPDGDGLRVLNHPAMQDARIISLTVLAEESDYRRAYECGVHAYLVKPFDPHQLLVTVRDVLEQPIDQLERRRLLEIERTKVLSLLEQALDETG